MLEIIGFTFLVCMGLFLLFSMLIVTLLSRAFGNSFEWAPIVVFGTLSTLCFWLAARGAPFTITWGG